MPQTKFSYWLNDQLERTQANPTAIAAGAGISTSYLSLLRRGERLPPSNKILRNLAATLDIELAKVYAAAERPFEEPAWLKDEEAGMPPSAQKLDYECVIESSCHSLRARVSQKDGSYYTATLQFVLADGASISSAEGTLYWLLNGQQEGEFIAPITGTTLRLKPGENEFRGIWEGEQLILKMRIPS